MRQLAEAKYERDREFRERAEQFYSDLQKRLESDPTGRFLMKHRDGALSTTTDGFSKDLDLKKLTVVFAPENGSAKGGMGHIGKMPVLTFYCLIAPGDPTYLATRLNRETVIHETIHYLDSLRLTPGYKPNPVLSKSGGDREKYYNTAHEWNAFWQEGAAVAERLARIAKTKPPTVWEQFFGDGTLPSFLAKATRFWDEEFIDKMNNDTRRKFDKRMADFWENVLKGQGPGSAHVEEIRELHSLLIEDEQQRVLRASAVDDDHRLPNVHRIIPVDRMKKIPYQGQSEVTIYRSIGRADPNKIIKPGDWVALSKSYAKQHGSGKILERRVLAMDVVWAGTDENEWFYAPLRKRAAR